MVKNLPANAGDIGLGRSRGEGNDNLLWYSCLKSLPGQRNLEGYSPRSHKELDTTERLSNNSNNNEQC